VISERFEQLCRSQLDQFSNRDDLLGLGVYVAVPLAEADDLQLHPVAAWPSAADPLAPADPQQHEPLLLDGRQRRWLPLRRDAVIIGALRVDSRTLPWSAELRRRLEAAAAVLSEARALDLEQQRLQRQLDHEQDQRRVLVHQMRNPLAALRTFTQLLLRRLEPGDERRTLVEQLLQEELQLDRYLEVLAGPRSPRELPAAGDAPLLLPPALLPLEPEPLADRLAPLLQRAAATAALQGRGWVAPDQLPPWQGPAAAVAEILANLLENAFRYSAAAGPVGLWCQQTGDGLTMAVWDSGPEIAAAERDRIFDRGVRGARGVGLSGTGLGLALARDQARTCGGRLDLIVPAADLDPSLPDSGNAFVLQLPLSSSAAPPTRPATG
jgi:signal transduction histidine kinase